MPQTEYEKKAEEILGEFEADVHPVNLKTGKQYTPSENEYSNAWEKAKMAIAGLADSAYLEGCQSDY